jgi:hypothetical protein
MARSEADIAAGIIRVRIGQTERELSTLKIAALPAWKKLLAEKTGHSVDELDANAPGILISGAVGVHTMELVLAYDRGGVLGGRKWLQENADPAQLYHGVLKPILEVVFPFVGDSLATLDRLRVVAPFLGAAFAGATSTNGRSDTGAGDQTTSEVASTSSK